MKRDMGLIRGLLLNLEALEKRAFDIVTIGSSEPELVVEGYDADQIDYHMGLLYEAGLITSGQDINAMMDGTWIFRRLTWEGHDFLDTVRDPEVWKRTKEGASKMGGWTFGLLKDLGTAYLKHVAKEKLNLDI